MNQLFKKAVVFTDIHFGKKSDSEQHNKDCQSYITWLCDVIREQKPDAVIFLGDWFDNRSRLRLDTLNYSYTSVAQLMNQVHRSAARMWWLVGNHDMFYKQSREITSLPWLESMSNNDEIIFIDSIMEFDEVLFAPWLIGTEYNEVASAEVKYVFGHFELPLFLMNEQVECPDRGGLHHEMFTTCDAVYSGHFHKRQTKINSNGIPVTYIGNCFPHNFNDANDRERGCMVLPWGCEPTFLNYPYGPDYTRLNLSELIELVEKGKHNSLFSTKSVVECYDDLNIRQEEALGIKDALSGVLRDIIIKPNAKRLESSEETEIKRKGKTVDQLIVEHIHNLDTEGSDIEIPLLLEVLQLSDES